MTASTVDLSDFTLWRNGFPDELFAELRRTRPLFRHGLTPGVEKTVKRDFWMTTKHRHAVRLHRDADSFTRAASSNGALRTSSTRLSALKRREHLLPSKIRPCAHAARISAV